MAHLIDKDALVAKIESKKKYAQTLGDNAINGSMQQFYDGMKQGCVDILSSLDTLEVKEVDLEKIINDYFKDWNFDDELDIMIKPNNYSASFTDLKDIAKHFFELGLKAQKGE